MRRILSALLVLLAPSLAAQDTTAIKALAKRDSVSAQVIYNATRSSTVRAEANKIKARTDSFYRAMRPVQPPPPPPPTTVQVHGIAITPASGALTVGGTLQVSGRAFDDAGTTVSVPINWASSANMIASVDATGLVKGLSAGSALITASTPCCTGASRFITVTVAAPPPPPPPPSDTTTPPPTTAGFDGPAELPRATVDVTLPGGYSVVDVAAGANVQDAINASACRVVIRLAPGATYFTQLTLPQKPCNEKYHTIIQTNNGLAPLPMGTRVTPALSASRRQAMIVSKDAGNAPALLAEGAVHGYYFLDLAFLAQGTTPLNAILYLGSNQTSTAQMPYDLVFRGVYVSGTPTLDLKRCVYLNSARTAFIDSWLGECHSNNGDSQCFLGLNGTGPYLIQNNYCEAGHEVIMFGGGDPSIPNLVPSDITIRGNHITRPPRWKGVWQAKNLIETKNAQRMLIEGNVIENNWADGQVGYALLFKSVNQDGTAPWSTSKDITVRYNLIRNTGAGVNLCAACQGTVVPMAGNSLHDNLFIGINVGQFTGEAREWQFLGALSKLSVLHNTTIGAADVQTAISFDAQPPKITTADVSCNAYDRGLYDLHGSNGTRWFDWIDSTTSKWRANLGYAPGGAQATGFDAKGYYTGPSRCFDGTLVGADAAKVYAMTARAVVTDPLRGARPRAVARPNQTGYRPTTAADRAANTRSGPSVR